MAKQAPPAVVRIIEGRLPSTGRMHRITLFQGGSIRIERDELPTIEESDANNHKWLIWLIEPKAYRDMTCIMP